MFKKAKKDRAAAFEYNSKKERGEITKLLTNS